MDQWVNAPRFCVPPFPLHLNTYARTYPHTEAYQNEVVRPTLGLGPKDPITGDVWNAFLAKRPEVRARVEAVVPWRKEVGFQIVQIFTTLSGFIHGYPYQIGDQAVTVSHQLLPPECCMASVAILDEGYLCEFDPQALKDQYESPVAQAASRSEKGGR